MTAVQRPWGSYEIIKEFKNYKVKILTIKADQSISLQYHLHRSEFWYIIDGLGITSLCEYTDNMHPLVQVYGPGYQINVPEKCVHKISAKTETTIVEIQRGDYLEEDDIIRLEDQYGRLLKDNKDE